MPLLTSQTMIGQAIKHYQIEELLGQGGMGAIYLAQNTQAFDRLCVVKEMIPYYEPGKEREAQERFEQEARTLAALKHPGIERSLTTFPERMSVPDLKCFKNSSNKYEVMLDNEFLSSDNAFLHQGVKY